LKRSKTHRGIIDASREAEEGIITLSGVSTGVASAWCGKNRSSRWRKKASERDENQSEYRSSSVFYEQLGLWLLN
jgi:hypothetical protein